MSSTSIAYVNTARTLASVSQQRATGELRLANGEHRWRLYFFQGRLVYATGTLHRVRRWNRAIQRYCPAFHATQAPPGEPWEYQLLSQSVAQQQVKVSQAEGIIKTSLEEVLFSWVSNPALSTNWSAVQRFSFKDNLALSLLLSAAEVEEVLERAQQLWKHWKTLELESLSPYKSPILKQHLQTDAAIAASPLANLSSFLTGRYTLWDIACHAQRPVTTVTRFLLPWVQRGAIALEEIADLPNPLKLPPPVKPVAAQPVRPTIACIDDSSTVTQALASILEPAGYKVLKILDPLTGIATLTTSKPDLILMDLVMPNVNGYDLCSFLRKTPIFQNTPIIILTSQNGIIDRTRARLSGASDFLTKPPDPQALLNLVRNYLKAMMSGAPTVNCQCWEDEEVEG